MSKSAVENSLSTIRELAKIAENRGQSLAQMAISWLLKDPRITSVLLGASSPTQLVENVKSLDNLEFSHRELEEITQLLKKV